MATPWQLPSLHSSESRLVRVEPRRDLDLYELTSEFLVPWISRRRDELRREQEHRADVRRLKILGSIAFALVLVAAAIAVLGVIALKQRSDARRQATTSKSLALAADAQAVAQQNPESALQLSLAAVEPYRMLAAAPHSAQSELLTLLDPQVANGVTRVIASSGGPVRSIAFSSDGRTFATGRQDGVLQLRNATTGRLIGLLQGGRAAIESIAFNAKRNLLAAGSVDGSVTIWKLDGDRIGNRLSLGRRTGVSSVAFSPDGKQLAAGGADQNVWLFSLASGHGSAPVVLTPRALGYRGSYGESSTTSGVVGLGYGRDGRELAVAIGGDVNSVFVWDLRRRRPGGRALDVWDSNDRLREIDSLAPSPDGRAIAVGGFGAVEQRRLSGGLGLVAAHSTGGSDNGDAMPGVALSPDDSLFAASDADGTITIWRGPAVIARVAVPATNSQAFNGPGNPLIAFGLGGHELAIGMANGDVMLWRPLGPTQFGPRHPEIITGNPNGQMLAAGYSDGAVRVFSSTDGTQLARLQISRPVVALAFSRDGNELVAAGDLGATTTWKVPGFDRIATSRPISRRPSTAAISPDLSTLAVADGERTMELVAIRSGRVRATLTAPPLSGNGEASLGMGATTLRNPAFSADGLELAAINGFASDAPNPCSTHVLHRDGRKYVTQICVSGTPAAANEVFVWRVADGAVRVRQGSLLPGLLSSGPGPLVEDLAFSPMGPDLAAITDSGRAVIWNAATRRQLGPQLRLSGNAADQSTGLSVVFTPDGTLLTDSTGEIQLWDVATSQPVGRPVTLPNASSLTVTNADSAVVTAGPDGVELWPGLLAGDVSALRDEVCRLIDQPLTRHGWELDAPGLSYETPCR